MKFKKSGDSFVKESDGHIEVNLTGDTAGNHGKLKIYNDGRVEYNDNTPMDVAAKDMVRHLCQEHGYNAQQFNVVPAPSAPTELTPTSGASAVTSSTPGFGPSLAMQ